MGKTMVVYVTFLRDVACQKLLNSANVSQSYSQNNTGTVFLRHGVYIKRTATNMHSEMSLTQSPYTAVLPSSPLDNSSAGNGRFVPPFSRFRRPPLRSLAVRSHSLMTVSTSLLLALLVRRLIRTASV